MGINFFRGGCGAVKGSSPAAMSCRRWQARGRASMAVTFFAISHKFFIHFIHFSPELSILDTISVSDLDN